MKPIDEHDLSFRGHEQATQVNRTGFRGGLLA
jgi:hypothetical protein